MTAGNGLTVAYSSYDKPTSITRGTTTIGFSHDPEHQRFQQTAPGGTILYLGNAEKFTGTSGAVRWTNYLMVAGGVVGMHVENSDETVSTRYFHKDHLGSISVITDESGAVLERLSYDAWGKRRNADGSDDPSGSITSQTSRGFTGHEELDSVGLVHMNGRVAACPRVGEAEPGEPAIGALRHRRSHDREPVLDARLEPLLIRGQLAAELHRPQRLLLHGLLLEVGIPSDRQFRPRELAQPRPDRRRRGDVRRAGQPDLCRDRRRERMPSVHTLREIWLPSTAILRARPRDDAQGADRASRGILRSTGCDQDLPAGTVL